MAAHDVLKDIVRNGSDLTLCRTTSYDVLRELAALAQASGSGLTLTTAMSYDIIRELSATYGIGISFVDGLEQLEKGK